MELFIGILPLSVHFDDHIILTSLCADDKPVSIEAGSALIQACEKAGAVIPRYCYHEKLMIVRLKTLLSRCIWPY